MAEEELEMGFSLSAWRLLQHSCSKLHSLGLQAQLNAALAAWDVSLYAWKIITAMDFLKDGLMMG